MLIRSVHLHPGRIRAAPGLPKPVRTRYTEGMQGPARRDGADRPEFLYFFPDQQVTADEARHLLRHGTSAQKAWVISHLLRYAVWDDIWTYVSRDEVREIFGDLDLPDSLRNAWGRMLKVEATVGR